MQRLEMVRMVAFGSLIILVLLSARVASFQSVNGIQRSKNAGRFTRLVAPPQPSRYLWPFNRLKPMSRRTFSSIDSYMEDSPFLEEEFDVNEMGAWVPVGSISCLSGLDPLDMEIMGRKFVVWRSSSQGQWSVLVDECSHRMAPLSQGRINRRTKCLECPYHGWAFDRNGTLQVIPQLEAGASLHAEQRSVESFPVHITGDLLWTFLPTSFHGEAFPKSLLPETWYSGLKDIVDQGTTFYTQDLPFSFDFFVEK